RPPALLATNQLRNGERPGYSRQCATTWLRDCGRDTPGQAGRPGKGTVMTSTTAATRAGTAATAIALSATLGLAAASWVVAVRQMAGMDMGPATMLGSLGSFLPLWAWMMAAMMLPGAAPAVLRRAQAAGARAVPAFLVTYLAVWTLIGVVAWAA